MEETDRETLAKSARKLAGGGSSRKSKIFFQQGSWKRALEDIRMQVDVHITLHNAILILSLSRSKYISLPILIPSDGEWMFNSLNVLVI